MSEETTNETNDGTWSGLKKTIIATLTTVIAGGGVWLSTMLFGGGHSDEKEEHKTEQTAPAPVIVNVQQNQENKQKVENGGTNTIIKERVIEKPSTPQPTQPQPQPKKEEESW